MKLCDLFFSDLIHIQALGYWLNSDLKTDCGPILIGVFKRRTDNHGFIFRIDGNVCFIDLFRLFDIYGR